MDSCKWHSPAMMLNCFDGQKHCTWSMKESCLSIYTSLVSFFRNLCHMEYKNDQPFDIAIYICIFQADYPASFIISWKHLSMQTAAGVFKSLFRVVKTNRSHSFCRMKVTTSAEWLKRQMRDPYVQMRRAAQYRFKLFNSLDFKLSSVSRCKYSFTLFGSTCISFQPRSIYLFLRARSAYKLIEIDDKYKLFKQGQCIVDCGAAPGAWTQVAVQRTQVDTSQGKCKHWFHVLLCVFYL